MLIKFTEVCTTGAYTTSQKYLLREIFVNPEHVVMVREEKRMKQLNEAGELTTGLEPGHSFSKLTISKGHTGTEIVVVGSPTIVETTLNKTTKELLKG
jgi:hypothetical protein